MAGPNRVIITATRSGQERNETIFYGHFMQALRDPGADENRDGRVSVWEAFRYAAESVARFVDVNLHLMLGGSQVDTAQQWQPIIDTTGDSAAFAKRCGDPTRENVIEFLTFDPENPDILKSRTEKKPERGMGTRELASLIRRITSGYLTPQMSVVQKIEQWSRRLPPGPSGVSRRPALGRT